MTEKKIKDFSLGLLYALGAKGISKLSPSNRAWNSGISAAENYSRERKLSISPSYRPNLAEITHYGLDYSAIEMVFGSTHDRYQFPLSTTCYNKNLNELARQEGVSVEDLTNITDEFLKGFNDENYDRMNFNCHKQKVMVVAE